MKIVVAGAGAIGGYVAARMLEAGLDVTLLVREARKLKLEQTGLVVKSPLGDYEGRPALLRSGEPGGPFDLAIIASKAYGLTDIVGQLRPYMHERTFVLPFLNGFKHMEQLADAFPGNPLLGGVARIESALDEEGRIRHLGAYHYFSYGKFGRIDNELYAELQAKLAAVPLLTEKTDIAKDLWDKYCFIAVLSGLTTLMDATVGEIRDTPDGMDTFRRAFAEAADVIVRSGGRLSDGIEARHLKTIESLSAASSSSMHRDMQKGLPTESEHIQGYLTELARLHDCDVPLLRAMRQRLSVYERNRTSQG